MGITERETMDALRRVGAFLEDEYDGPPGPQDGEGGNGIPSEINELAFEVANFRGYSVDRIYTEARTLVRREREGS